MKGMLQPKQEGVPEEEGERHMEMQRNGGLEITKLYTDQRRETEQLKREQLRGEQ